VYLAPIDLVDKALGRKRNDLPPKSALYTGVVKDFEVAGDTLLDVLRTVAAVTPQSAILDIGCGMGRLGRPAAQFLDPDGRYEGLDIVSDAIKWCKEHISSPHGNVNFTLVDVHNQEYNPKGTLSAAEFRFPFDDDTFDVAVLVSVFTHMLPTDVEHYVCELVRVLKPAGRIFATTYLMNEDTIEMMNNPGSEWHFKHHVAPYWTTSLRVPELSVGYDEDYLRRMYIERGLSDHLDVYPGSWCGRTGHWPYDSGLEIQDVVVATKV